MLSLRGSRRLHGLVLLGLLGAGLALTADALWLAGKAKLAQVLLQQAWSDTLAEGGAHKPWPWADHWPVARLEVPGLAVDQIVLAGESGAVLAFAPGQNMQAGEPGGGGTVVISGHRDTHFRFLQDMRPGMQVQVQTPTAVVQYRVRSAVIVDARAVQLPVRGDQEELVLVTCYPFDSLRAGGSLRYLVWADRIGPAEPSHI